ncbi:hypothetical protein BCR34DRAFT_609554 [Clohesyomyces aquaticus]|uniref:Uncharacterized protein n=1 Tax=Clohesyomyces aquaticus TaxID=1231657 RepID=A0A1Y2ACA5_9PLEO|nr:hypothetical protein BCR34DRAFT_609554 [Clohesyomyces aquaticus]
MVSIDNSDCTGPGKLARELHNMPASMPSDGDNDTKPRLDDKPTNSPGDNGCQDEYLLAFVEQGDDSSKWYCKIPGCSARRSSMRLWRLHVENSHKEWLRTLERRDCEANPPESYESVEECDNRENAEKNDEDSTTPPKETTGQEVTGGKKSPLASRLLYDELRNAAKASKLRVEELSQENQRLRPSINRVLDCVHELEAKIEDFRNYVATQDGQNKPTYQWSRYEGYPRIGQSIHKLGTAVDVLKVITADRFPLNEWKTNSTH